MTLADELLKAWSRLHRRLAGRADSEHEQIVIRIVITTAMFLYIISVDHGAEDAARIVRDSALIYAFAATASVGLLVHLLARPRRSPARRFCGIVTDAIGVNGAMFAGGEAAMLFFPLLLWSILGHGFRYGRLYLAVSAVLSTVLFIGVVVLSPAWRGLGVLDIGLVMSLVMLPGYFAVLLGKLEGAVHKAEDASRAKSRFLATMSHEFRTPLNAVIGMTDLLRTTPLDAEQRDMVATTRSAAHSLLALVNDVLDIAKIEAGRFVIDEEPFDLHRQLATLRRMLYHEAQAKGLYLRLRLDPRIPPALIGGRGPLHQILVNLTANAIKFTNEGGVLLDVRSLGSEPDRPRLRFEVHDTGIGIAVEAQQRIFESFGQAEGDTPRRFGGTGLGLAIAKELTELMQGTIGVVSAPGQGSSFWVELALRRDPVNSEAEDFGSSGGPSRRAEVVVLGGRAATERAMARLQRLAITAIAEPDIAAAVDQAASSSNPTAILVVDADPAVDVETLVEALDQRRPNEPVDIVTLLERRREHLAASLADLAEADDDSGLERALRAALVGDGQLHGAIGSESLRANTVSNVLLVEDNRTNQHVIGKILEHAGHAVTLADSGEECIELMEANAFDVVLLDLNMPGMSGFNTLKMLRFMLPIPDLPPVVALTADATAETRDAAMALGFAAYLTKPIDTLQMLATIDRLAGQQVRHRARALPPSAATVLLLPEAAERATLARAAGRSPIEVAPELSPPAATTARSGGLDTRKIDTLLELDAGDGFFAQVVDDYLLDVTQLEKELHEAVAQGNARAFRDAAHALKSSSAHIGAQAVFEFCVGLRHLDDHALLMRASGDLELLRQEIERARAGLLQCKERALRAPSRREIG
jgi:two-component system sensor histidine kinase RpfC